MMFAKLNFALKYKFKYFKKDVGITTNDLFDKYYKTKTILIIRNYLRTFYKL